MSRIDLFVPTYDVEGCLAQVRECLECGWTGLGFKTLEFERAWCGYTQMPYAHFLNSATSGLAIALDVLNEATWGHRPEVITSPLTFVSTAQAIVRSNEAIPVFADVDEHLCLDPEKVEAAITPKTKAVIFVGMGGSTGRLAEIAEICVRRKLALIIDGAHMAGTRLNGKHVGIEYADATIFSFHSVKNLPTADGGMVCFPDEQSDARARKLSWLGIDKDTYQRTQSDSRYRWKYDVVDVGYKAHGNSIMAAIGLAQLARLDADNERRRAIARNYDLWFKGTAVRAIPQPEGCESSRHLYQVRVNNRDEAILKLNERDIYPGVHYRCIPEFGPYADWSADIPNATQASNELISLPIHLRMTPEDVDRVAETLVGVAR